MPYIPQADRAPLTPEPRSRAAKTPGELNFQLTTLVRDYCINNGLSYQTINDALGALEGAKLEFYRRVAAPYEDKKIAANGDVF